MISQSATSINDFKHCPMLYNLRHVLRLRPIEDATTLRMGSRWHECLEVLEAPGEDRREALIAHLNKAYETCPPSVDSTDWEIERIILLYSAIGWQWHWADDQIETIACEVPFDRQVNSVYRRRGKIDAIIKRFGLSLRETKSTSKPIDPGSYLWSHLKLDTQVTLYIIEARHAQLSGKLEKYGIKPDDPLISGVLYDVWHKPTIRPKKLSMAETKKFLESGVYYAEEFSVEKHADGVIEDTFYEVNGVAAETVWGKPPKATKKNPDPETPFTIRETPEMFGARLLADILENPEKHFARKDISRTDAELRTLDAEYYGLARLADFAARQGLFFRNEHHCNATYRCKFSPICHFDLDVSDGKVPDGFICLNKNCGNSADPNQEKANAAIKSTAETPESTTESTVQGSGQEVRADQTVQG